MVFPTVLTDWENAMETNFELSLSMLAEIAHRFAGRVREGLARDGCEIRGLVTYVPTAAAPSSGRAVVVDLGGTRVRAAMTSLEHGRVVVERGPVETLLPVTRGEPLDAATYLGVQADLVASLDIPQGLPLGYCFSYPAAPQVSGDAALIKWTKEIFVPGTEGRLMGAMLLEALEQRGVRCCGVSVINDTVASLLAGLTGEVADAYIGLIVGTGTNTAALFGREVVPKLPADFAWSGPLPVNLESGNFHPPHLTALDDEVDAKSDNPGAQRFEKAVSGAYLGRLLAAAQPDSGFDPESGSAGVVRTAGRSPDEGRPAAAAAAILERSARLVAASLAGVSACLSLGSGGGRVKIIAEGGLYWGAPGYSEVVDSTLAAVLPRIGLGDLTVAISSVAGANLTGSTFAALARR